MIYGILSERKLYNYRYRLKHTVLVTESWCSKIRDFFFLIINGNNIPYRIIIYETLLLDKFYSIDEALQWLTSVLFFNIICIEDQYTKLNSILFYNMRVKMKEVFFFNVIVWCFKKQYKTFVNVHGY